jgi:hypothetical protein
MNVVQIDAMKITNRTLENVAQLIYLQMTEVNQQFIEGEVKGRLNLSNVLLPFSLEPFVFMSPI